MFSEARESGKLRKTSKEVPLSDILNLEIRWHPYSEQSETPDISTHMGSAFGSGKESENIEAKGDDVSPRFDADDWFQDDPRSTSNDIPNKSKTEETTIEKIDAEVVMSHMHDLSFMLDSNLSFTQQSDKRSNDDQM